MVTVSESLDDLVVPIVVCPTVVIVAFTVVEEFVNVVESVFLLEKPGVWLMVDFGDGDVVFGWPDAVVTFCCKVVPLAWVEPGVFLLVIVGKVRLVVGTGGWVVVEILTVVEFVHGTEVLWDVAKSVVTVVVTLLF